MSNTGNEMLTIQQIEEIAVVLRKYRLTPADALSLSKALVHSVTAPVPVKATDLASLMRPRRPAPPPDLAGKDRRYAMRTRLEATFLAPDLGLNLPYEFLFPIHPADYEALKSAVQYRATKAGLRASLTKADQRNVLVRLEAAE